jgi:hypothetical protein
MVEFSGEHHTFDQLVEHPAGHRLSPKKSSMQTMKRRGGNELILISSGLRPRRVPDSLSNGRL